MAPMNSSKKPRMKQKKTVPIYVNKKDTAQANLKLLREADILVVFISPHGRMHGTNVEIGFAIGLGLRVILVMPSEEIFQNPYYYLDCVERIGT